MRHKGMKPAGQPRSLRSIAEQHSEASNFPTDAPFNYQQGAPDSIVGGGQYDDAAKAAAPKAGRQETSADPKPF